jgi:thiamine biosynthesis lipoprotein
MPVRLAADAMGTRFEVVLAGGPVGWLRAAGESALREIEQWDRRLSLFRSDSTLSHVNRAAGRGPVRVDGEFLELLAACRDVHAATGGAFDPTVAPLMRALGLHACQAHASGPIAESEARRAVGFHLVELDESGRTVRFAREGVALDLGSIGKGHALDAAAGVLREAGVRCAFIQGGTSGAVAIGTPPGRDGWCVRVPVPDSGPPLRVSLRDRALSVSSPSGRSVHGPEGVVTHVLDPRTGRPAAGPEVVVVTGPRARDADAWSTALLVDPTLRERVPPTLGVGIHARGSWRVAGVDDLEVERVGMRMEGA